LPATQAADTGEPAPLPVVERKKTLVQSDEVIIRLVDVHKSFDGLTVLDGVCLELYRGHTTVMLGPSGTGKTVLLKLMVGLLKPDSGEVWFDDQRVDKMSSQQLVELRTRIGYLFQMGALFDSMNVRDNVSFPLVEHTKLSRRERLDRCDCVLGMVGLPQIGGKMPSDLSGGQKKRVALARAIVLEPNVVLYDEPTTGLDPIRADLINELINSLAQRLGITSIVVTHDMISANKIADRMLLLYDGQIIADGAPAQFARTDDDRVQRFIKGQAEQSDLDHIWAGSRSPANSGPSPT
jgi:phospholipid/cholesterol/gamma-HCH transport system ATP-binding protein